MAAAITVYVEAENLEGKKTGSGLAQMCHPHDTLRYLLQNNAPFNTYHPSGHGIISELLNYFLKRGDELERQIPISGIVDNQVFRFKDGDKLVCRPKARI